MTKRLAPCLMAAGVPIMRLRGAVGRLGTKVGSAAALAVVCAVVAAVGLVAAQGASSRDSARTRWIARSLGKVAALGINDRGQIAGSDPVEGAVLWRNGRWRTFGKQGAYVPDPPLENGDLLRTPAVINNRGQVIVEESEESGWLWQNGRMHGRFKFQPVEINERGQVVGSRSEGPGKDDWGDPIAHAFVWQNGTERDLGTIDPTLDVGVAGINDDGQIVGDTYEPADSYVGHGFLWENGGMHDLGTLGGDVSSAAAINNHGQIVGSAEDDHAADHAFLWQNGAMQDLGNWWPIAINDRGQIVGSMQPRFGRVHAVLWQDGNLRDLGVLPGDRHSAAIGINERGQIIGESYKSFSVIGKEFGPGGISGERPFVWENGHMTALPVPRPGVMGTAVAINNNGQIIGWTSDDVNNDPASVLWTRSMP